MSVLIGAEQAPTSNHRGFLAIEAYRGIAAIAVAVFHGSAFFGPATPAHAYLAVDFFFMLSGIVMAHSYDARFLANRRFWTVFIKLRIIRLYPVIIAATLFAAMVHFAILSAHSAATPFTDLAQLGRASLLTALLIPQLWSSDNYYPLNGPFWSLMFELIVNIAFALGWRSLRGVGLYLVIGTSAVLLIFLLTNDGGFGDGFHQRYALLAAARTSFGFFVGVAIARLRSGSLTVSNQAVISGVLLLFAIFWQSRDVGHPADRIVVLLVLPAIAWFATRFEPSGPMTSVSRFLGKISYPLYAFNLPAVLAAAAAFKLSGLKSVVPGWAFGLFFIASSLVAARVIDRYFDEPVRRRLTSRWARRQHHVPSGGDTGGGIG